MTTKNEKCRSVRFSVFLLLTAILILCSAAIADVAGSISGIVQDASGAVLAGAQITAVNVETGIKTKVASDSKGFYSFAALPVGTYNLDIVKSGFKTYKQSGVVLRVNDVLRIDATLVVGNVQEQVSVQADAVHVETTSTQMGEVISEEKLTSVPLNGRSYTDLLALQPGVAPVTSGLSGGMGGEFTSTGFGIQPVSGDLNAGNLSVNGMRESGNGFLLNGAGVQEMGFGGTAAIPDLDSIQEFRILTNNFDAEYGSYAGSQINVITKSGTNTIHGSVFEFFRNTTLDATQWFNNNQKPVFQQNQFGGTLGGPVVREKVFFFADFQGTRQNLGQSSGSVVMPSTAERGGDFSALASSMTGTVQGTAWANQLSQTLGYPVTAGEPYYTAGCTSPAQCVFPGAQIPTSAFTSPSKNLLKYIPIPNGVNGQGQPIFASAPVQRLADNKGSARIDADSHIGLISAYYFMDDNTLVNPNPFTPGFGSGSRGRVQVVNLADTKIISSSAVNEARIAFTRLSEVVNQPIGGIGSGLLAQLGFTNIVPSVPDFAGVPHINFQNFGTGSGSSPLPIIENTYAAMDNFSKVVATHTFKFGGLVQKHQLVEKNLGSNGSFSFGNGNETGIDFADFLIGAPNNYSQGQGFPSYGLSHSFGLYGQDSWRVRSNLILNYGLRWDVSSPWSEMHNEIETIIPGEQSVVFPGSPTGWVFPGDPHVPSTLAPTRYNNFAPRVGIAYSPAGNGGWDKITGGPGNFSLRAGWGKFYTTFEGATNFNEIGDAPFGYFYGSPAPPQFANPFITRSNGFDNGQRFPVAPPPFNSSAQNPDTSINWPSFLPIGSSPAFYYKNVLPYAEDYEMAVDRQFGHAYLLTIAYVGTQGHHLLSAEEANPGNPALCLSIPGCGPNQENTYNTRQPLGPNFTSNSYFKTIGNSDYNSLQLTMRHSSTRYEFLAGYTYARAMDTSSGYGEQVNVLRPTQKALSAFDVTHNFVTSYSYSIPFDKIASNRLTTGWRISGITRFSTGLPVTMLETDDNSLLGTSGSGPIQLPIDTPNFSGGTLHFTNPRSLQPYFNTSLFTQEPLGHLGTASRRFFHGPGTNNWDITVEKDTAITERMNLQFRSEFFNAFNHAQFGLPDGNFNDSSFGLVQSAAAPRILQLAMKLVF